MKNADMPAMPVVEFDDNVGSKDGLTKREYFAAMAMQGILSSVLEQGVDVGRDQVAIDSVRMADALLAELERR